MAQKKTRSGRGTLADEATVANELGISLDELTTLRIEGYFDNAIDGQYLILERAQEAYRKYKAKKDKKLKKRLVGEDFDPHVRLDELLRRVRDPKDKVKVESDFWTAMTRRANYLLQEGELITLYDARRAIEDVVSVINTDLDELPIRLKGEFPEVSQDVVDWLVNKIDKAKRNLWSIFLEEA